jgi:sulfide:quinone oxidoreductase
MKKLLILGAGTAGTIMANKMRKALPKNEWGITIVEKELNHYYQPGFLFLPFGHYNENDIKKPTLKFFPQGIDFVNTELQWFMIYLSLQPELGSVLKILPG